jgi:hypothetical protein
LPCPCKEVIIFSLALLQDYSLSVVFWHLPMKFILLRIFVNVTMYLWYNNNKTKIRTKTKTSSCWHVVHPFQFEGPCSFSALRKFLISVSSFSYVSCFYRTFLYILMDVIFLGETLSLIFWLTELLTLQLYPLCIYFTLKLNLLS